MPAEPILNASSSVQLYNSARSDWHTCSMNSFCPIQIEGLMVRCMNRPSFAALILHELEISATELINTLKPLVDAGDCVGAIGPIHSLRGASAIAGAASLSRAAATAELAARRGDSAKLRSYFPIICREWDVCKTWIPEIVSTL